MEQPRQEAIQSDLKVRTTQPRSRNLYIWSTAINSNNNEIGIKTLRGRHLK